MQEARVCYRVPDYYKDFVCKGGACRHSCCQGWPISMSMKEYFRLLSLDCSPDLRRRLDVGLHLADNPSPERYAHLMPNWLGQCPLRRDDGLCALHAEMGENAICEICRLYPRSPRRFAEPECACSNSCEHTLELLFARTSPLAIEQRNLSIPAPEAPTGVPEAVLSHYIDLRQLCIEHLQDRTLPLGARVIAVGRALNHLQPAFAELDSAAIDLALKSLPEPGALPAPDESFALSFLAHFNRAVGLGSRSVHDYAQHAIESLGLYDEEPSEGSWRLYHDLKKRFKGRYPDWEIRFEQILVNHVFYESFPFSDRHEGLWDEFLSLCAVYGYAAFLALVWTDDHPADSDLVDVIAAAFRLIDHSAFDYNAAVILKRLNVTKDQVEGFVQAVL